jgi:glycosyltransferase involved in cell wall biosynthesis
VGGLPEVVEDGVTGRLYEADRPDQLAHVLRDLIADASARQKMGEAARERIEERYTWKSVGPQYTALYHSLLPESPGLHRREQAS